MQQLCENGTGVCAEFSAHTEDYEASVRIRGTQRILGRAAIHGAVKLSWHSLQNQLLPLSLGAPIQQAAPHPRPGEERLRENLILSTPKWDGKKNRKEGGKNEDGGVERAVQRSSVSLSQEIKSKVYMNNTSSNFLLMQRQVNNMH